MVNRQDQVDIHCNLFDGSFVEYALDDSNGCFEVVFDQKLFDAPEAVLKFEQQMLAEQEAIAQKNAAKAAGHSK